MISDKLSKVVAFTKMLLSKIGKLEKNIHMNTYESKIAEIDVLRFVLSFLSSH